MSTYQIVARALNPRVAFADCKASFWRWWTGLYAEPPRKLPPML